MGVPARVVVRGEELREFDGLWVRDGMVGDRDAVRVTVFGGVRPMIRGEVGRARDVVGEAWVLETLHGYVVLVTRTIVGVCVCGWLTFFYEPMLSMRNHVASLILMRLV